MWLRFPFCPRLCFSELRETNNLEWTLKMTNLTEDGEYLLAKNQSEHQQPSELKPYKKQYLADREKKYFEKNEIGKFSGQLPVPITTSDLLLMQCFRLFVVGAI